MSHDLLHTVSLVLTPFVQLNVKSKITTLRNERQLVLGRCLFLGQLFVLKVKQ